MKNFMLLLFVFAMLSAQSQTVKKKDCDCKYSFTNQVGLYEGQKESFLVQTIHGIRKNSWFGGVGVGIDGYRVRSIPLFLDVRKSFGKKANGIFAYVDGGVHFPWLRDEQKFDYWGKFEKGYYFDGGLGYKIGLRKHELLFSGGFSIKQFKEVRTSAICPFIGPCFGQSEKYEYLLRRATIKVGFAL